MIVTWEEVIQMDLQAASDNYPLEVADPKDYTRTYTGEVLRTYETFWGTPRFLVLLDSGEVVSVRCTKCKVVKRNEQVSTEGALEQAARQDTQGEAAV